MATPTSNTVPTTVINVANFQAQSQEIQAIVDSWGVKWGSGGAGTGVTLTYSFIKTGSVFAPGYGDDVTPATNVAVLSAAEQAAVESALSKWEDVANVRFTEVTETASLVGEIRIGKSFNANDIGASGYAYLPANSYWGGDLWLSRPKADESIDFNEDGQNAPEGSYDFSTLLHELGHALGLQHPHDDSFEDFVDPVFLTGNPDTAVDLDLMLKSVMSYQYGFGFMPGFEPTTPMVLDIAAMHYLYGANTTFNKTNTTYSFSATGQYNQTIWDAGGTDTIVYTGAMGGVINLKPGEASHLGAPVEYFSFADEFLVVYEDPRTVWIALGAKIENATGGTGNDEIIGNTLVNVLKGMGGNDTISGAGGNDQLLGGTGNDTQFGGSGNDKLLGEDGNDTLRGEAGDDDVRGGNGKDKLSGEDGHDMLFGDAANDEVRGGLGNDVLRGGDGNDKMWGDEGMDDVRGAGGNDTLFGGSGGDILRGEDGDDRLIGGTGGDNLGGGAGLDIFVFDVLPPVGVVDKVGDFAPADDTFQLLQTAFSVLPMGALAAGNFAANAGGKALDTDDYIVYDNNGSKAGTLYYDADGNTEGGVAAVQIAVLTGAPALTFEGFVVI